MKKIFRSTLAMAMLAIACYGGVKAFEKCVDSSAVSLIAANVEALSMPEGDGEFPRYKNVTKKSKYFETKFEYEDGENGKKIKVEFKRSCTTLWTYCKHTGNDADICYERMNGKLTDCDSWQKAS